MGSAIFIKDKNVCIQPLATRLEAIKGFKPPNTPKDCKSFTGVLNYLSMVCQHLQKLLQPIYDLTRKGRPFIKLTCIKRVLKKLK